MGLPRLVGPLQETHGERMAVDEQVLVFRLELLLVGQPGKAPVPSLHDDGGQVRRGHMVVVGAVVHRRLPVERLNPFDGAKGLGAVVQPVEADIQQPPGVAQVVVQAGSAAVPGGEHDAGVGVHPCLHQAQEVAVQRAIVCFLVPGHVFQLALVGVGPAVVGAGEVAGIAHVGADDAVAPVAAHVQVGPQAAPPVATEYDRLLAHVGVEEVVGIGHQGLVADHQPGPPEHFLLLFRVDVRINEYPPVQLSGFKVDYLVFAANGNHRAPPGEDGSALCATVSVIRCILSIHAVEYGAVEYGAVEYGAVEYGAVEYGAVEYGAVEYGAVEYGAVEYGAVEYGAVEYGAVEYGAVEYGRAARTLQRYSRYDYCRIHGRLDRPDHHGGRYARALPRCRRG